MQQRAVKLHFKLNPPLAFSIANIMLLRYSIAMYGVNRSLIIVKPKQRFLDWIHSWDSDRHKLEDIRIDPTAYLISQEYDFD